MVLRVLLGAVLSVLPGEVLCVLSGVVLCMLPDGLCFACGLGRFGCSSRSLVNVVFCTGIYLIVLSAELSVKNKFSQLCSIQGT